MTDTQHPEGWKLIGHLVEYPHGVSYCFRKEGDPFPPTASSYTALPLYALSASPSPIAVQRETVTYGPCVSCGVNTRSRGPDGEWRCQAVACMPPISPQVEVGREAIARLDAVLARIRSRRENPFQAIARVYPGGVTEQFAADLDAILTLLRGSALKDSGVAPSPSEPDGALAEEGG